MIRRRFFTLAAAVSLLLCAATCVMWLRSYWVRDFIGWHRHGIIEDGSWEHARYDLCTDQGLIGFGVHRLSESDLLWVKMRTRLSPPGQEFFYGISLPQTPLSWGVPQWRNSMLTRAGFQLKFDNSGYWSESKVFSMPLWAITLVFSVFPVRWLANRENMIMRIRRGLCSGCGYDLRATPGRCPECGLEPLKSM